MPLQNRNAFNIEQSAKYHYTVRNKRYKYSAKTGLRQEQTQQFLPKPQ